jgi:PBP1b-binding outer membrane lipoprotein LpoB
MRSRMPSGSRLPWKALLVLSAMLLTGCGGAVGSSSCRTLPLRSYEPAQEQRIVDQARVAGLDLQAFFLDAVALRDAVRACRG